MSSGTTLLYKEAIKLFAVFLGGFGVKSYLDRNK